MNDLNQEIADRLRSLVEAKYSTEQSIKTLMNEVIGDQTDFEHIITFLDESSSSLHKGFATELRETFEKVLRDKLGRISSEHGGIPDELYFVLLDMHTLPDLNEQLVGILTTNYDGYIENAILRSPKRILDVGVAIAPFPREQTNTRLLKLHGSFDWSETWPISPATAGTTLWIPPGVQKAKDRYPFNLLWGLARELLDCDILRVVGCRLGPNDWDLISLLFSTRYTNASKGPYRIEIIDAPKHAHRLQSDHPYLGVQSLLEIEPIGRAMIAEITGAQPRPFVSLNTDEREGIVEKAGSHRNWFQWWLKHKAEAINEELQSITTDAGALERFLETY